MKQGGGVALLSLLFSSLCGGCDPFASVGMSAVVIGAAGQERGLEGIASDTSIRLKIDGLWLTEAPDLIDDVNLSVQSGLVVLTGIVGSPHLKAEAVRLTRQVEGVTSVIDEIKVGPPRNWSDVLRDRLIAIKLNAALLGDEDVRSRNYVVEVVDKVIYLMGIAQDQEELDLVIAYAREIPNVRQVISHVQFKDQIASPDSQGYQTATSKPFQSASSDASAFEFDGEVSPSLAPPAALPRGAPQGKIRKVPAPPFFQEKAGGGGV